MNELGELDEDYGEEEQLTPNGDIVLWIARGVGFLVAIVAILLCFMIMMLSRALIAFLLNKCGVSGVLLVAGVVVWGAMRYRTMSFKVIWTMLSNS
eukprot:CAMPEP_0173362976 /NCGR_PEP_ID=MMETSP1144-20121109/22127_1 /TAXON_ID=483371 /ORGANISM="non described non described, Strain CCMP2298" /LENGTH=95 /DNA_ID=CAMNT_0014312871 /DNA_START=94 /DNA_END=377 /DNA_ORIENTATION=+